ncbi:hypothetical protein MAR_004580, partial [Mya arenaria]
MVNNVPELKEYNELFDSGNPARRSCDLTINAQDMVEEQEVSDIEDCIFNSHITEEEVLLSVKSLKDGKAAGEDYLPPEFFKISINHILPLMVKLFNRIFSDGYFPEAWSKSIIVPIFKKGDPNITKNFR